MMGGARGVASRTGLERGEKNHGNRCRRLRPNAELLHGCRAGAVSGFRAGSVALDT